MDQQGRREQYRVELDEAVDLQLMLPNADGADYSGKLIDVSSSGAGARFEESHCPSLAVGQEIDLHFTSRRFKTPITVAARVQHRGEEQGFRRYGFRFLQPQQLDAYLAPDMRHLFNRRKTMRVSLNPFEHIATTLGTQSGVSAEVRLHDLSTDGVKVSLETVLEPQFTDTTVVTISIRLPDVRHEISLAGVIRYRLLVGNRIHYGIMFDAERSDDFRRRQDAIGKFVAKRRLDDLRQSA